MLAPARARQRCARRLLRHGRRPGRARLRRPLRRARPPRRGRRARAAVRRGAARLRTSTCRRRRPRGCATPASRPPVRRAAARVPPRRPLERPPHEPRALGGAARRPLEPEAEVYAALVPRPARLRRARTASEHVVLGLSGGIDSALVALRRRRRARRRSASACAVMPSPLLLGETQGDARALARHARRSSCFELPIAPAMDAYERDARGRLRGPRARHHGGEPPGAHPRQPADGALEQVRLARADDRQQVGDVGRLLDAVRRPRRRLRGDQGRARRRSSTSSCGWRNARDADASRCRASIIDRAAERRAAPRPARRGLAAAL